MAKKGMKRPDTEFNKPSKDGKAPVPEVREKVTKGKDNNKIMPYNNQNK
jgi:hypothetical protein